MPAQKQKKQKTPWNAHRKARQAENYGKQEKRKEARREVQKAAEKRNAIWRENDIPTKWEYAKNERMIRRANRPA